MWFLGDESPVAGGVIWRRRDDTVDVAVVEVADPARCVSDVAPVRWGG